MRVCVSKSLFALHCVYVFCHFLTTLKYSCLRIQYFLALITKVFPLSIWSLWWSIINWTNGRDFQFYCVRLFEKFDCYHLRIFAQTCLKWTLPATVQSRTNRTSFQIFLILSRSYIFNITLKNRYLVSSLEFAFGLLHITWWYFFMQSIEVTSLYIPLFGYWTNVQEGCVGSWDPYRLHEKTSPSDMQ